MDKVAATLTYYCKINERTVFESFTNRKDARKRALHLSNKDLARDIKIINHP